jgi:hypothetical protein
VLGDPVNLVDPSGLVVDTAIDAYFITGDIACGNWRALALDTGSLFLPFVAGLGHADDFYRVARGEGALSRLGARLSDESGRFAPFAGRRIRAAGPGARYPLHPKIQRKLGARGWTTEMIDEAIQSGQQVRAINKATGNPATRYIHPQTGQSVVLDDIFGQVIHVGGPGFRYGPGSGDVP